MEHLEREHILIRPEDYDKNYSTLNLGPTHPATHGIFQNILETLELICKRDDLFVRLI